MLAGIDRLDYWTLVQYPLSTRTVAIFRNFLDTHQKTVIDSTKKTGIGAEKTFIAAPLSDICYLKKLHGFIQTV